MSVKKIILRTHLILGLASGMIILFLAITGCILAFQKEIENATQSYRFIPEKSTPLLPPSQLKDIGVARLLGKHLHSVLYQQNGRSAQVIFFFLRAG